MPRIKPNIIILLKAGNKVSECLIIKNIFKNTRNFPTQKVI